MPGQRQRGRVRRQRDAVTVGRWVAIGLLAIAAAALVTAELTRESPRSDQTSQASTGPASVQTAPANAVSQPTAGTLSSRAAGEKRRTDALLASLSAVVTRERRASRVTFHATYSSHDVIGALVQVTVDQMPPDRLFRVAGGEVLVRGARTYYCVGASSPSCTTALSTSFVDLRHLAAVFDTSTYTATVNTLQRLVHLGTVPTVLFSRKSIADQSSDCISWQYGKSKLNYCVTLSGVLASFAISGGIPGQTYWVKLTSYSAKPAVADFKLPAPAA